MNGESEIKLKAMSFQVREDILKLSKNGGCFTGASLSCTDIITYLYKMFLNIDKKNLQSANRDYFFLSKGHDVPALYGALSELGFFDKLRLENHLKTNDYIYWHPNTNIPGIEFHSGSLGHLLAVATGVAIDCKLRKTENRIVVLLGDGELNEGSVWEAIQTAKAKKLDNLVAIIDRNYFQANIKTEELIPLEPLDKKFEAFGWDTFRCNGHDFNDMEEVFNQLNFSNETPSIIIMDTVRGKGVPSIEERADRWFCNFTTEEVEELISELRTGLAATIKSETLIVR